VEHKEALGLILVLSVLERLINGQCEVFTACLLRFELGDLVGLDVNETLGVAYL